MQDMIQGFFIALGLIVAIGAQNAWMLGQSLKRQYHYSIAFIFGMIDAVLVAAGILFMGQVSIMLPSVVPFMTWIGVALLLYLALSAFRRALRPEGGLSAKPVEPAGSWQKILLMGAAISLLNPHVYLDTFVLLGGLAALKPQPWLFWSGCLSASFLWFYTLAFAGGKLRVWLSSERRWQLMDGTIGSVMLVAAWSLSAQVN